MGSKKLIIGVFLYVVLGVVISIVGWKFIEYRCSDGCGLFTNNFMFTFFVGLVWLVILRIGFRAHEYNKEKKGGA
jgi:hypothetical protein